jgi:hypothetical protein
MDSRKVIQSSCNGPSKTERGPAMSNFRGTRHAAYVLIGAILIFSGNALLAPRDAAAQFVCADTAASGQGNRRPSC